MGPDAGEITIQIKTIASGVSRPDHRFRFLITPILNGTTQDQRRFDFPNYVSSEFVTIIVSGLEKGRSYIFIATATNIFGSSDLAVSPPQYAGTGKQLSHVTLHSYRYSYIRFSLLVL